VPPDVIVTPVSGTMFYTASGGLSIDVEALMPGSTIPNSGFQLLLNGEDVTSQLTLSGTGSDFTRIAQFNGLLPNRLYRAVVRVTDSTGLSTEVASDFDTFVEADALTIEAEDYNYSDGTFTDNPAPGDYLGTAGTVDTDYTDSTPETLGVYRATDAVDMDDNTDIARQKFSDSGLADYQVIDITTGEWLNYTRTFPNKVFTPYLRAGAGADRHLRLDRVTGNPTQPNQTIKAMGLFVAAQTRTVNTYRYVPLSDAFGTPRSLNLSGQTTVRLTATDVQGDVNHNYLFFAAAGAAKSSLPWALSVSPAPDAQGVATDAKVMVSLVDGDNAVNLDGIQMRFDDQDVTAALTKADTTDGADITYNPGTLAEGTTHTVQLTIADTAGGSEVRTWSFKVTGTLATGPKIAWVSFHPADNTPATDAATAGFTQAPDVGYTQLLASKGYMITRVVTSGTPDTTLLNTFDLVIISRSVPSGDYQDPAETLAWNGITAPTMIMGGYIMRNSRLGFTTGGTIPDTTGTVSLKVNSPTHPVFEGVALDAGGVMVNPYANLATYTNAVQRGISVNTDPVAGGGIVLATIATAGDPAVNGLVIGEWPAGATLANGAKDVLGGHRLVFLSGSREAGSPALTSQGAGIYDLTEDGAKLFLNAVKYLTEPPATPAALAIQRMGSNVVISWQPAGGTLESSANLKDWSPVAGATSPATIAIGPGEAFYRVKQ
jgi:hypothetical protein